MKPFSPQITIVTIITIIALVRATDKFFEACEPQRLCGGQAIRFPFYINGVQEPFCGYPGFDISCHNNYSKPIINLSGDDYVIHKIFYHNQSLIVSNAAFSNISDTGSCFPSSVKNLSLPADHYRFTLSSNQTRVFLLYEFFPSPSDKNRSCSAEKNDTNNNTHSYYYSVMVLPESRAVELSRNDSYVVVVEAPVLDRSLQGNRGIVGDFREVLRGGFMMNWTASGCRFCESSGGKCGFDYDSFHFKCFCPDRPHAARCDPPVDKAAKLSLGLGLGVPLGVLICLIIVGFFIRRCYVRRRKAFLSRNVSNQNMNADQEAGFANYGVPLFSYKDLEEATNNFNSEKELGDGGFGTVYHGVLKDGRQVAVKRLYEHNYKRVEQFVNEVEILTRLRHRNLVTLYGCTSRRSRELLLVYEYIPNGTVADHLHGDSAATSPLAWPVRLSVAVETATALAYLHASDTVHRDVKTNNILLDDNFCVKVADFGLSRLFPNDVTHVSTAPQGTPGYVDPEYHQCYQLTNKSDVYSFGVVLVELVSSMPAVDITRHRHEINLSNLATSKIKKRAYRELVDLRLGFDSDDEAKRSIIAVAELAFKCLQQDKEMRPTMEEVLEELKRIESGDNVAENRGSFDGVTTLPPPSPECDEAYLLKSKKEEPLSPNAVTENWPSSRSITPNISA